MGNRLSDQDCCSSNPSMSYAEVGSSSASIPPEDQEINDLIVKKDKLQKQITKIKLEEEIRRLEIQVNKETEFITSSS